MSDTVMMPKLGFDMQEGTLVRWVKNEGEEVNKGEILAEIETDKATVEVESSFSGVVARHLVGQGDIVPVGAPIAVIAAPGETVEDVQPEGTSPDKAPTTNGAGDENPPSIGGGEQAAAETPGQAAQSPAAQKTEKELAQAAETPVSDIPAGGEGAPLGGEGDGDGRLKVSPLARRIAREQGVDLSSVQGSGPGGRIVRSDVEAFASRAPAVTPPAAPSAQAAAPTAAPAAAAPAPKPQAAPVPPAPVWSGSVSVPQDETTKLNRLRQIIGRRMVESKQQVPHIYVTRAFKLAKMLDLRKQLNAYLPDDQKLTVNDFVIKAVALTLRQFPNINASLNGEELVRHGHVNVGSAVSIEGGLMTVVVKDADQKPLRLISAEMRELVAKARIGKVRPEDIEGSTFSISNMGMYEVEHFVAIINPPEAAILAVGSAMEVPVVEDGQLQVGMLMRATISADHRVTDGAEAARFMQMLASYIEDPMRLIL